MENNPIQKIEHAAEEAVEKLEKKVEQVEKKIERAERKLLKNKWVQSGIVLVLVLVAAAGILYAQLVNTRVSIDKSQIAAPAIDLSPIGGGPLNDVYVNEGDIVPPDTVVARVGDELIKTKAAGEIIAVHNDIGKMFAPGQPVVTMIDPTELRVVGTIDEDKGLSKIRVGLPATFTVDAFGSKTYEGVVDEISPTSHQSGVVFNISDKRQIQSFDVKVRFDVDKYPELKNGMSARITIFYR